ncbi:hypothetical protein BMF94_1321 [Rhodotorula taiwanensis]|uniref:ACB domain-containing protein n=1 Tax=Rhodotorula taiwanensis TaxID=741276 RepID=A0A2S5BG02_9BASI|nr:hypothetical protein BMF94_1321 [Rhodotorula taiwanensis]
MTTTFKRAVAHVGSSDVQTDNQTKLRLYALYKIATVSQRPIEGSRPGMLDFTGRAKWDAWDRQGAEEGMDAAAAQAAYVELARDRFDFRIDNDDDDDSMQRGGGAKSGSTESVQRKRQPKKEQMVGVSMMADDFVDEAPLSRIHELALEGDATALEAFLARNSSSTTTDLNVRDSYGYTPLHLATDRGQTEAVKVLLGAGADRSLKDDDGNTALDLARLAEHSDIVALLT